MISGESQDTLQHSDDELSGDYTSLEALTLLRRVGYLLNYALA